jgi:hypothetical protein
LCFISVVCSSGLQICQTEYKTPNGNWVNEVISCKVRVNDVIISLILKYCVVSLALGPCIWSFSERGAISKSLKIYWPFTKNHLTHVWSLCSPWPHDIINDIINSKRRGKIETNTILSSR